MKVGKWLFRGFAKARGFPSLRDGDATTCLVRTSVDPASRHGLLYDPTDVMPRLFVSSHRGFVGAPVTLSNAGKPNRTLLYLRFPDMVVTDPPGWPPGRQQGFAPAA